MAAQRQWHAAQSARLHSTLTGGESGGVGDAAAAESVARLEAGLAALGPTHAAIVSRLESAAAGIRGDSARLRSLASLLAHIGEALERARQLSEVKQRVVASRADILDALAQCKVQYSSSISIIRSVPVSSVNYYRQFQYQLTSIDQSSLKSIRIQLLTLQLQFTSLPVTTQTDQ